VSQQIYNLLRAKKIKINTCNRGQFENPPDYFYRGWNSYVDGFGAAGES
jgi:hypothetical protein